jgi:hypothetical protein
MPATPLRTLKGSGINTDATPILDLIGKPLALTHAEVSSSRQYGDGSRMKVRELTEGGNFNGREHVVVTFSQAIVRVIGELLEQAGGKKQATFDPPFSITFRGTKETGYSVE